MNPVVAIVGRPNVGKSTLMNKIIGKRTAIVEPKPGVTRDRKEEPAEWQGRAFTIVDTGGWLPGGDALDEKVSRQSEKAMESADVVLFVVDVTSGVSEDDAQRGCGAAEDVSADAAGRQQGRRFAPRVAHVGVPSARARRPDAGLGDPRQRHR